MIIALVGDVHGDILEAKAAIYGAAQRGAKRIIFLGDFGFHFDEFFVSALTKAGIECGLIIEWIDGNHEDFDYLELVGYDFGPNFLFHPRGSIEVIDGIRFMFLGGATSVDRQYRRAGKSWWPQEALTFTDIANGIKSGKADVLLSHDAPYLPPMMDDATAPFPKVDLDISVAHRYLYRMVYKSAQPSYVFHGHFHIDYFNMVEEKWGEVAIRGLANNGTGLIHYMTIIDTKEM